MKKTCQFTLAAVTAVVAAASGMPAQANLALAQQNACTACHAVDKKVLGPAPLPCTRSASSRWRGSLSAKTSSAASSSC